MNQDFDSKEKLYRAVYPPEICDLFWKSNGELSSAAFSDKKGLSADRGDSRPDRDVITDMLKRFSGRIVSVTVELCRDIEAEVYYRPSHNNPYHSEIHGSKETALLSKPQRRYLARYAKIEYSPDS